jgi:PAS domain S-box-containing protein
MTTQETPERRARILVLIFCALSAGIVLAGLLQYQSYRRRYRAEVAAQLSSIAELKINDLRQYRAERLGDAAVLCGNPAFSALVRRTLAAPQDRDAKGQLQGWLKNVRSSYGYDRIRLLDVRGVTRLSVPPGLPSVNPLISGRSAQVLAAGKPEFQDFYINEQDGKPYLSLLAPIRETAKGGRPLGVVVLRISPRDYLYPYIQRWPTPSRTAETLLVRKDGDDILYLNELRFQKDTALKLRIPLTRTDIPAVAAVLGRTGVMEGVDYRGEATIAAIQPVPGSPWFLAARIDASEVYGPLRRQFQLMAGFICVLLASAGLGMLLLWRRQSEDSYREQYEMSAKLRESEARFRGLFQSSGDALMTLAPPSWSFTSGNPAAIAMFRGEDEADFTSRGPWELSPERQPDGRASADKAREMIESAMRDGSNSFEWTHKRLDGEEFSAEVLLTRTEAAGAMFLQATVRDVSERKKAEAALRESEARVRAITDSAQDAILMMGPDGGISYWNPMAEKVFGYTRQEALGQNLHDFLAPKRYHEAHRAAIGGFKKTGQGSAVGKTIELEAVRKGGEEIVIALSLSAVQIRGEWNAIGIVRDITESKRMHAEREAMIAELQKALAQVKTLSGFIPICGHCKKIRDDKGFWESVEKYVGQRSEAQFSHGVCPDCAKKFYGEYFQDETPPPKD